MTKATGFQVGDRVIVDGEFATVERPQRLRGWYVAHVETGPAAGLPIGFPAGEAELTYGPGHPFVCAPEEGHAYWERY